MKIPVRPIDAERQMIPDKMQHWSLRIAMPKSFAPRPGLLLTSLLTSMFVTGCTTESGPDPMASAGISDGKQGANPPLTFDLPDSATDVGSADSAIPGSNPQESAVTDKPAPTEYNKLSELESYVIVDKGTEPPDSYRYKGAYTELMDPGTYICRQCNQPLYESESKFHSGCGWPAFDDEIKGAVTRHTDSDGFRTEITCSNCDGHLGHVFFGEGFTKKDSRHCVNSVSMKFIPKGESLPPVIRKP